MTSQDKGSKGGFPIRRSLDQSSFAAPQGLSQRTTSFIASQRQGIHQMLLRHLITLTIHVRSAAHRIVKERPVFSFSAKDMFCLPSISGTTAAGRRWFAGPRGPACRICCLFTISNIRAAKPGKGRARTSFDMPNIDERRARRARPAKSASIEERWWSLSGSNRRPEACKATALPAELRPHVPRRNNSIMVGLGRLERPTSPLSGVRSNHLSYRPSRTGTIPKGHPSPTDVWM
jgi:hypothetical protein